MLFDLALIFIAGLIGAKLFTLCKLPDIVGMIFAGIFLRYFSLLTGGIVDISADLRQMALVIILTRAGLSLDLSSLKQSSRSVILLSFLPATFEICAVAGLGVLLFQMDIISALILGSVLSAVSPAIVVPRMINLKKWGYGKERRIPEMMMAGASIDDIFVIILFYSFISFDSSNLVKLPLNIILGVVIGIVAGLLITLLNKRVLPTDGSGINKLVMLLLSTSFVLLKLEDLIPLSPLLAIMVCAIVFHNKEPEVSDKLEGKYLSLWSGFSVLLFVFVGYSVELTYVFSYGLRPLLLIALALCLRSVGTYICVSTSPLNQKEKLFCIFSYLPKATVQAGIGFIPMSMGLPYGELILTISAIAIIVTAPLGAILIDKNYKKLLIQG